MQSLVQACEPSNQTPCPAAFYAEQHGAAAFTRRPIHPPEPKDRFYKLILECAPFTDFSF